MWNALYGLGSILAVSVREREEAAGVCIAVIFPLKQRGRMNSEHGFRKKWSNINYTWFRMKRIFSKRTVSGQP